MNNKLKTKLGFVGCALLVVGIFLPIYNSTLTGKSDYFQNGSGDGVIVLILAIISMVLILVKKYKGLWLTGLLSLIVMGSTLYKIHDASSFKAPKIDENITQEQIREMTTKMIENLQAQALLSDMKYEWGWIVLFLGLLLMFFAVTIKSETISNKQEKEFSLMSMVLMFAWVYPLMVIIIGAVISFFQIESSSIGFLLAMFATCAVIEKFSKTNKRYLNKKEKINGTLLIFLIFIIYQILFVIAQHQVIENITAPKLLLVLIFTGCLGFIGIALPFQIMEKNLKKREIISKDIQH